MYENFPRNPKNPANVSTGGPGENFLGGTSILKKKKNLHGREFS